MINRRLLDTQLILDEGIKLRPYTDSKGFLTIGAGRNLDTNPLTPTETAIIGHDGRTLPISLDQAIFLLHNDEAVAMSDLAQHCSWWVKLDDVRARVMVDLMFNMGWGKLSEFQHFLADMSCRDFYTAASELKNSLWYSEVGNRGPRLVGMVSTGEDYTA